MSTKRKYDDQSTDQPTIHSSRQAQVPGSNPPVSKKPRRIEPPTKAHVSSVNGIKKRIRDITRKLRAENLPADVRVENERALAMYEQELETAQAEKIRQKMISKYHMVRFFERQKATKQLKKLKKRLLAAESLEEVEEIKRLMHISEVDLNYAQYSPLSERYISLFPAGESSTEESTERKKPPMWAEVERRMEEGTLDELRNRRPAVPTKTTKVPSSSSKKVQPVPKTQSKPKEPVVIEGNRRERRRKEGKTAGTFPEKVKKGVKSYNIEEVPRPQHGNDDQGSDGGFFDE